MSRSKTVYGLVFLLGPALGGCAAKQPATAPCPPCQAQASTTPPAQAHAPATATASRVSMPPEPQYVALQLFVLDTQRTRGGTGTPETSATELPKDVYDAAGCKDHPCRLISAPTMLGHHRAPMQLDVGNLAEDRRLSIQAEGRSRQDAVDLELVANLIDDAGRHRMRFSGSVAPGGVTHLGTVGREGNGAHEVFGVLAHGDAKDAVAQLEPWRPRSP